MGVRDDEREWLERTAMVRWRNGSLPNGLSRFGYAHPILGALGIFVVIAGTSLAMYVLGPNGRLPRPAIWAVLMPPYVWWALRSNGELWRRWRAANPGAVDRYQETKATTRSSSFLERWDARNQTLAEVENAVGNDFDITVSPLARRYLVARGVIAGVAVVLFIIGSLVMAVFE